jgi:hypothetical protein
VAAARVKDVLPHLDTAALRDLAEHQLEAGHTREEVVADIVAMIDALVPWAVIIPGPIGVVVEALDGPIAKAIAGIVVNGVIAGRERKQQRQKP